MQSVIDFIRNIKVQKESILVFGAGRTGFALAKLFSKSNIAVEIWDEATRQEFLKTKSNSESLAQLEVMGVKFCFNAEPKKVSQNCRLLIPSPGISPKSALFDLAGVKTLEQIGEFELGLQILTEAYAANSIVVTGSNGKSTTTSLIHFILHELNFNSKLCGNIGTPVVEIIQDDFLSGVQKKEEVILAIEASSYQLESCNLCSPDVAVMLNLTENHLDRHGNMQAYFDAKKNLVRRLTKNQTIIFNSDDEWANKFAEGILARHHDFGVSPHASAQIDLASKSVLFRRPQMNLTYQQKQGFLLGDHNLYNIAAAILAAEAVGVNLELAIPAAYKFKGLEHRLEILNLSNHRIVINDSKATTVNASLAACQAVVSSELKRKIILLIGGEEKKGSDWGPLFEYIQEQKESFDQVLLFGFCNKKLQEVFRESAVNTICFESLKQACEVLTARLSDDNLALLSPGCASFDEFLDFEDRGRFFKRVLGENTESTENCD